MANSHIRIGNGPHKVIALHGWFGSATGWGPYAKVLDEARFSYAFMDYRGYGGSKLVKGEFTIQEIAADALALADALDWNRRAKGAGHYPMDETPVALATSIEKFLSI